MSRLPAVAGGALSANANAQRQPYPSDLSDAEWKVLEPFLPQPKGFGHPRTVDLREIINAIFYVQRSGCQWEMLPHDFPPHTTVYNYFQKWQRKRIWQKIHEQLRYLLRGKMGRDKDSTVASADSQSVKTTEKRGLSRALMVARKLKAVNGT